MGQASRFNPRVRGGRDAAAQLETRFHLTGFNPRVRGGRDLNSTPYAVSVAQFQSARPWGTR